MAKFTREQAKDASKKALAFKKKDGDYTVIVVGDNGFNKQQVQVISMGLITDGREHMKIKRNYNGNVVLLSFEELDSDRFRTNTQKGLENALYRRVNEEIEYIIDDQINKIAKETLGDLGNFFK